MCARAIYVAVFLIAATVTPGIAQGVSGSGSGSQGFSSSGSGSQAAGDSCVDANFTGCCITGDCQVGSCYCDQACYNAGDCCSDIEDILCFPDGFSSSGSGSQGFSSSGSGSQGFSSSGSGSQGDSCVDANFNFTGCCFPDDDPACEVGSCWCDQLCYSLGDCCSDIEDILCFPDGVSGSGSGSQGFSSSGSGSQGVSSSGSGSQGFSSSGSGSQDPARIHLHPEEITEVKPGSTVQLRCVAYGTLPLSITWSREGSNLTNDSERISIYERQFEEGQFTFLESILQIFSAELGDDSGIYGCLTENEFGTDTVEFELIVTENFTPVFGRSEYRFSVLENSPSGQALGSITVSDADGPNDLIILSLIGDGNERFVLDKSLGYIITTVPFDREFREIYNLRVDAQDQGTPVQSATVDVIITILDENDNAPVFSESVLVIRVNEDVTPSTPIFMVMAEDPDAAENITYAFVKDIPPFTIDTFTGVISSEDFLDRETEAVYSTTVEACDFELCAMAQLLIHLADVNDNPPVFDQPSYRVQIYSDYTVGTTILRPLASDADSGTAGHPTYSLLNGSVFAIDNEIAEIRLAQDLPFTAGQFNLTVLADDGVTIASANITVDVSDGLNLPRFESSLFYFSWPENNDSFMMDLSSSFNLEVYAFQFSNGSPFEQDGDSGMIILTGPLDREDQEYYTVEVMAVCTCECCPTNTSYASITLRVIDANDNPPVLLNDEFYFTVEENEDFAFDVGSFVVDDDTSVFAVWSLAGGEGVFTIDQSGKISLESLLDRETNNSYSLIVIIEDPVLGSTSTATVNIAVTDVNDNAPVFENIESGVTIAQLLDENVAAGLQVFFQVRVRDEDLGENGLIFFFLEGESNLPFSIQTTTGSITGFPDFVNPNQPDTYSLTITAVDQGTPQRSATATLNVQLFTTDPLIVFLLSSSDNIEDIPVSVALENNTILQSEISVPQVLYCTSMTPGSLSWVAEGNVNYTEVQQQENSSTVTIVAMINADKHAGSLYCVSEESGASFAMHFSDVSCMCISQVGALSLGIVDQIQTCGQNTPHACDCSGLDCECQNPFSGDGQLCSPDPDGDGVPNAILPSCTAEDMGRPYCNVDNCPVDFNPEQDERACEEVEEGFSGCTAEVDEIWSISWSDTFAGLYDTQNCSGGTIGLAIRLCMENGEWGSVDVTECISQQFVNLEQETIETIDDPTIPTEVKVEMVNTITNTLIEATSTGNVTEATPLYPQELSSTVDIVNNILDFLITETTFNSDVQTELNTDIAEVIDNVLEERNQDSWNQLEESEPGSGSQMLLMNVETYGTYLVQALTSDSVDTGNNTDRIMINGSNLVLEAQVQSASEELKDVVFHYSKGQINITADVLRNRAVEADSELVSTINIVMMNIQNILPDQLIEMTTENSTEAQNVSSVTAAMVISSQILTSNASSPMNTNFPGDANATIEFTTESVVRASNPRCVFWNFRERLRDSGWSREGVETTSRQFDATTNTYTISCETQHLTSFCVLVDITGEQISEAEASALELVSYIGSGISMFFLVLTIIFFLTYGKELLTHVHHLIHLNLAISLFLGYATFVSGIENATSSRIGCKFVAALLHYLFLSVFCWMLCEGIMLYLLLVVVFSKLSKQWWLFLLIGWGLPFIIVAIAAGVSHEQYAVKNEEGQFQYCWISVEKGALWAFVGPMLTVICINIVFWILALRSLYRVSAAKMKKGGDAQEKTELARKLLLAAVILLPLLGLTWVFGLLSVNQSTTVFSWLFTILNSLQGLFIFIFHVLRSDKVWKRFFGKTKQARGPTMSSRIESSGTFHSRRTSKKRKSTSEAGRHSAMSRRSTKRNDHESLIETSVDETMSGSAISKNKNLSEMASGSIIRNKKKSVSEPKAGPSIAKKSIKKTTKQKKRKSDVTDPFAARITVFSNPVFVQNPLFDDPAFENQGYAYPDYSDSEAEDGFDTLRTWV